MRGLQARLQRCELALQSRRDVAAELGVVLVGELCLVDPALRLNREELGDLLVGKVEPVEVPVPGWAAFSISPCISEPCIA